MRSVLEKKTFQMLDFDQINSNNSNTEIEIENKGNEKDKQEVHVKKSEEYE